MLKFFFPVLKQGCPFRLSAFQVMLIGLSSGWLFLSDLPLVLIVCKRSVEDSDPDFLPWVVILSLSLWPVLIPVR